MFNVIQAIGETLGTVAVIKSEYLGWSGDRLRAYVNDLINKFEERYAAVQGNRPTGTDISPGDAMLLFVGALDVAKAELEALEDVPPM